MPSQVWEAHPTLQQLESEPDSPMWLWPGHAIEWTSSESVTESVYSTKS